MQSLAGAMLRKDTKGKCRYKCRISQQIIIHEECVAFK